MGYVRDYIVNVERHDGTLLNGQPTYHVDDDWDVLDGLRNVRVGYSSTSGRERVRGQQVEATSTAVLTFLKDRNVRDIKSTDRIKVLGTAFIQYDAGLNPRTFEIVAFGEDKDFLRCECIELTDSIQAIS